MWEDTINDDNENATEYIAATVTTLDAATIDSTVGQRTWRRI
jgi:hypothetical protein